MKIGLVLVKKQPESKRKLSGAAGEAGVVASTLSNTLISQTYSPGDVLTAETKPGKTWEKEGKRSGKLVFSETVTEYRDQNGELVITARGVGVRTERPVDQ